MPLFLNAEPHSIGSTVPAIVALRNAVFMRSIGQLFTVEEHLEQLVVLLGNRLDQFLAPLHRQIA